MENEWEDPTLEKVTIEDMNRFAAEVKAAREAHDKLKSELAKLYHDKEEKEQRLIKALKGSGNSKYFVEGLGTAYIINRYTVETPKTIEAKEQLFNYIANTHGDTVLKNMVSINHQTLNSFVNKENEANAKDPSFSIPGLGAPTHSESLGFRKA